MRGRPDHSQGSQTDAAPGRRVAVLMTVHNGARFLDEQIESLVRQSVEPIDLWVSDDGSEDKTAEIIARTVGEWTKGEARCLHGPGRGFAENYRALMTMPEVDADYVAFCDQDDHWDDDKLATAIAWLETQPEGHPALYCSRTRIVSEDGSTIGVSQLFPRQPSFRNALVQSIAGGNTMVMNRAAHAVIREASTRATFVSHDWWCYQIVTGVGGTVHYSPEPKIGYRQHDNNAIGENITWRARMARVRSITQGRFREWNERNLAGLLACRDVLTPEAQELVDAFQTTRGGGLFTRIAALRRAKLYRQTPIGQIALYTACILRKL